MAGRLRQLTGCIYAFQKWLDGRRCSCASPVLTQLICVFLGRFNPYAILSSLGARRLATSEPYIPSPGVPFRPPPLAPHLISIAHRQEGLYQRRALSPVISSDHPPPLMFRLGRPWKLQ